MPKFQPGNKHGKRWPPGESGNPDGNSRGRRLAKTLRDRLLDKTADGEELMQLCIEIAQDKKTPAHVRLQAATWMLERCYGKAEKEDPGDADQAEALEKARQLPYPELQKKILAFGPDVNKP